MASDSTIDSFDTEDLSATMERLSSLVGCWRGEGVARFPTIDLFEYDEELVIELAASYPMLRYEQRTVLKDGTPSHWEMGFVSPRPGGAIELSNVQSGGRVEVLRGKLMPAGAAELVLDLKSAVLSNDPRMIETTRRISIVDGRLSYELHMSTTTTDSPQLLPHLAAELVRDPSGSASWVSD